MHNESIMKNICMENHLPLGCWLLLELLLGRLKMFDIDVVMLRRFESPRLNGSYELAVSCGAVAADGFKVFFVEDTVWP